MIKKLEETLRISAMVSLGFDYDSWAREYKIPRDCYNQRNSNGTLFNAIRDKAQRRAEELMEDIDLSSIELSSGDKKAIISAYKRARRIKLEEKASDLAHINVETMINDVFDELRKELNETVKSTQEKDLIAIIFDGQEDEKED